MAFTTLKDLGIDSPYKKEKYDNFINNQWVKPVDGKYFENLTPISGKPFCEVARSNEKDIELALDAAHAAKDAWGKTSTTDRANILIKIAEMMKQYPEAKFKIEGHTDSVGPYQSNKRLSQTRANAVRNYLISSDIPSENLTAEGFGETRPVASNLTKEGQRLNRRVEIIRIK